MKELDLRNSSSIYWKRLFIEDSFDNFIFNERVRWRRVEFYDFSVWIKLSEIFYNKNIHA